MLRYLRKASTAARLLMTDRDEFALRWRQNFRRPRSGTIRINGVRFEIDLELDELMAEMFYCTYEHKLTAVMKRFLHPGDAFLDVGANVGYTSAIGMGLVGRGGEVHAFEPVPFLLERLRRLGETNPDHRLFVNPVAVGEREGEASIAVTNLPCIGWNTLVPNFMSSQDTREELQVPVITLETYLDCRQPERLHFVKIDTEGYELPIMRGFAGWLRRNDKRPAIVIEVAPAAYPRLNTTVDELFELMTELGYTACDMDLKALPTPVRLEKSCDVAFLPA